MARPLILVGVDFEAASMKALAFAKDLASKLDAEVVLAHCYAVPVYTYPGLEPVALPAYQTEISGAAKRAVEDLAKQEGGLRSFVRSGDPAIELLALADELKPLFVVVGTHGRRGLTHLLLGSVAEKIVRRCLSPVLTVRLHEPTP